MAFEVIVELPPIGIVVGFGEQESGWRISLLHCEASAGGSDTTTAAVAQLGRNLVGTRRQSVRVNLSGSDAASHLDSGAGPVVFDRTPGIEIGAAGVGGHWLACEDFRWLCRAGRGGWHHRRAAEHKHAASLESNAM